MSLNDLAKNMSLNLKVISESKLVDLHKVLLIILDDLIQICNENDLKFALIGGSAIGALREGGFISWDDDIDIAMPRKDFQKLYEIVKAKYNEKYSIIHPQDTNNYGRILPKIRLKGTDYKTILEYDLDESGIFIDVYLIENVPNNITLRYLQGIICLFMGFALSCRRIYKGRTYFGKFDHSYSFNLKKLIGFFLSFASIEKWARWTDYWYSKCKDDNSEFVSVPSDDFHFFGETYKRNEFCNYLKILFEGRECYIPQNFDSYLRKRYGDYLVPPDNKQHERNLYISYDLGKYREVIK